MEQILTAIAPFFDSRCFLGLKSLLKNEDKKIAKNCDFRRFSDNLIFGILLLFV